MESRGAVPCGSLGINDSNTQRSSQQKWTRQRGKQGAASSDASAGTQIHIHSTEEGEGSGDEPVVPRGPEWVDEHVRRRPSSRTGPYCHRGSWVSNISDPHRAGEPSPVRIRSPALDSVSLPQPESVVWLLLTFERLSSNSF